MRAMQRTERGEDTVSSSRTAAPPGRRVAVECPHCELIDVSTIFRVAELVRVHFLAVEAAPLDDWKLLHTLYCERCGRHFRMFTSEPRR